MNVQERILQNQLEAYLAEQPETGGNSRIESLERIGGRGANGVYAFTLAHDEAGETVTQKLVLKIYVNSPEGVDRALKSAMPCITAHARYPCRRGGCRDQPEAGRPF